MHKPLVNSCEITVCTLSYQTLCKHCVVVLQFQKFVTIALHSSLCIITLITSYCGSRILETNNRLYAVYTSWLFLDFVKASDLGNDHNDMFSFQVQDTLHYKKTSVIVKGLRVSKVKLTLIGSRTLCSKVIFNFFKFFNFLVQLLPQFLVRHIQI